MEGLNDMVGKEVIIRTYSAGNWFGTLSKKCKNEVILTNARRMRRWYSDEGTSLSEISRFGINQENSQICYSVDQVWLEAIEIIPTTAKASKSIKTAPNHHRD